MLSLAPHCVRFVNPQKTQSAHTPKKKDGKFVKMVQFDSTTATECGFSVCENGGIFKHGKMHGISEKFKSEMNC